MSVDAYDYDCELGCSVLKSLREKLEAVRNHLNAVHKDESDHFPWSISSVGFNKLMTNLYKILEASG